MKTQSSRKMSSMFFLQVLAFLAGIGWLTCSFAFPQVYNTCRFPFKMKDDLISKKFCNLHPERQWSVTLDSRRTNHILSKRCLTLLRSKSKGPKGKQVSQIEEDFKMCTRNKQKENPKNEVQESKSKMKTFENGSSQYSPPYTEMKPMSLQIDDNTIQSPNKSPRAYEGKGKAPQTFKHNWPTSSLHGQRSPIRYGTDLKSGLLTSASKTHFRLDPYDRFTNPYATVTKSPMRTFPQREIPFKEAVTFSTRTTPVRLSPAPSFDNRSYSERWM